MITPNNHQKFTILLVDDREENLVALEEILEQPDRIFLKSKSGNEALKIILKNDNIGLIMLDVQMPDMDGYEVARLLQSNSKTQHISIIFVTANYKDEQHTLKGFKEGAVDYLHKPLDVDLVKAKVDVFQQLAMYQQSLKQSYQEIEKINKQLERFVYIVSHDLKSPLSSVVTILSILKRNQTVLAEPVLKDNINTLASAADYLSEMISSILEYSRQSLNQQTIEEVNVKELVDQIISLLFPPKNVTINNRLPDLFINTKKLKLQQVFQNLISNAIKYNDKTNAVIDINYAEKKDFYEFSVKDNGPGIEEQDQKLIFKLFQTTSNKSNSDTATGVGLNILKMLVEEQGGTIQVQSEKDKGSTFSFEWKK